jgi:hypothetical protein
MKTSFMDLSFQSKDNDDSLTLTNYRDIPEAYLKIFESLIEKLCTFRESITSTEESTTTSESTQLVTQQVCNLNTIDDTRLYYRLY